MVMADPTPIRPGDYVRCLSLAWVGRVETVFADDDDAGAAVLEAQGGGWIAAPMDDLAPVGAIGLH